MRKKQMLVLVLVLLLLAQGACAANNTLLNASFDPIRELHQIYQPGRK